MKKIILYVSFVCLCLFAAFYSAYTVSAEETYDYYIEKIVPDGKNYFYLEFNLNNDTSVPVAWYSRDSAGVINSVRYCVFDSSINVTEKIVYESHQITTNVGSNPQTFTSDNIEITTRSYSFSGSDVENTSMFFWSDGNVSTNVPLFNSYDDVVQFILTGNNENQLNKPQYDLSIEHDFNSDIWTPDIPVPELSQISHTGFTLDNWTEDYYVDIIVKNHLSRVRIMQNASGGGSVPTVVDTEPWYSEHYWNFTLHDVLTNRSVVDINDIYGVDIQSALIEDFKNWSSDYPTIKDIQGYSWTLIGQADDYLAKYVYKPDNGMSDVEQLKNSGQAQTEYYVRYVTLDGKYGQWAHYRLRDYSYNGQGERIEVGRVTTGTVDNTGKPSSTITGTTDTNGNIDYTPIITTPSINTDVDFSEFLYLLETSTSVLQQFPLFISQLFLFLPWWVNALIGCAIAMCILLRIVGR